MAPRSGVWQSAGCGVGEVRRTVYNVQRPGFVADYNTANPLWQGRGGAAMDGIGVAAGC